MTTLLGVDGGGTRTRAVVTDGAGVELGRGEFAGSVVTLEAPEHAAEAVRAAVEAAAVAAGVALPATLLWAGLAGAGGPRARTAIVRALEGLGLAERVVVGTDVEAAYHAAFGDRTGILLIAGTGSIAWARRADGSVRQIGGWGRHLGDEGSGYAIGLEALRSLARAHDGRDPASSMRGALLARCGVSEVPELIPWIESASKSQIAALAPSVVEAADDGDRAATAIIDAAISALLRHAAVARSDSPDAPLVLWGGLIAEGGPLHARMEAALAAEGVEVVDHRLDPPLGAARLAMAAL